MAGVVDVTRGPVCDTLSSMDAIVHPELPLEGEDDFSGTFIVDSPQCLHFWDGERWVEIQEEGSFGCGCY